MKKKTIGIVTIFDCDNYGADLQAYALPTALNAWGYQAELIDYPFYKSPRFRRTRQSAPILPLSFINRLKEFIVRWRGRLLGKRSSPNALQRAEAFAAFRERIPTSDTYPTLDALLDHPPAYDVYMTGSDQVWNPRMGANIRPYFLDFLPEDAVRVAYAASFGVSVLPDAVQSQYKTWLNRYRAVGCREAQGVKLVQGLCPQVPVQNVLDPTLLLTADQWLNAVTIPDGISGKRYLLVYELVSAPALWDLVRHWAADLNAEIVRVVGHADTPPMDGVTTIADAGPGEFVGLFSQATAVVTTSFHGTAFSTIFNKPFYSVIPSQMKNSSRQHDLLDLLGLLDRMIPETDVSALLPKDLSNWNSINEKLISAREKSKQFLTTSVIH